VARVIALLIFVPFSAFMLYHGIVQLLKQRRSLANATPVDATIVRSLVVASSTADTDPRLGRSSSTTSHRPDVRFCYSVSGREYESELLYPTRIVRAYASADAAADALRMHRRTPADFRRITLAHCHPAAASASTAALPQ
jgi:hypothetical protein